MYSKHHWLYYNFLHFFIGCVENNCHPHEFLLNCTIARVGSSILELLPTSIFTYSLWLIYSTYILPSFSQINKKKIVEKLLYCTSPVAATFSAKKLKALLSYCPVVLVSEIILIYVSLWSLSCRLLFLQLCMCEETHNYEMDYSKLLHVRKFSSLSWIVFSVVNLVAGVHTLDKVALRQKNNKAPQIS